MPSEESESSSSYDIQSSEVLELKSLVSASLALAEICFAEVGTATYILTACHLENKWHRTV
jgi:hypothetical protein